MYCSNCGHELTGHMKFCSHCGKKQTAGSTTQQRAVQPAPAQRRPAAPQQTSAQRRPAVSQQTPAQRRPAVPQQTPAQRRPAAPQQTPVQRRPVAPQQMPQQASGGNMGVRARRGRAEEHHFEIHNGLETLFVGILIGGLILFMVLIYGFVIIMLGIEKGIGDAIALLIFLLLQVGVLLILFFFSIWITYHVTTISGRRIRVKKLFRKKEYDCSEIKSIYVRRRRTYRSFDFVLGCCFTDGSKIRINYSHAKFAQAASYFLDLIDNGLVSPEVADEGSMEWLRKIEVRAW